MMITINVVAAVMISALVAYYEVEDQHCPNQHDRQVWDVIRMCALYDDHLYRANRGAVGVGLARRPIAVRNRSRYRREPQRESG